MKHNNKSLDVLSLGTSNLASMISVREQFYGVDQVTAVGIVSRSKNR